MSTISLALYDVKSNYDFKEAFSSIIKNACNLKESLEDLKNQIATINTTVGCCISEKVVSDAESYEEETQCALSFAYDEMEEYTETFSQTDSNVAQKIKELKNDFYCQYSYLKPNSEKGFVEKAFGFAEKQLGKVDDFLIRIENWCAEHIAGIIAFATTVAIVGLLIVSLPLDCILALCSGVAFLFGGADLISSLLTGKSVSSNIKEDGHPLLADFLSGIEVGVEFMSIFLGVCNLKIQINRASGKLFSNKFIKNVLGGLKDDMLALATALSPVSKLSLSCRIRIIANIVIFNQSPDFSFKESISAFGNPVSALRIGKDSKHIQINPDGTLSPKSEELISALAKNGFDTDHIHTVISDGVLDWDPEYYGTFVGETDFVKVFEANKATLANKDIKKIKNDARSLLWKNAENNGVSLGASLINKEGITLHELYNLGSGKVKIYAVPSDIHSYLRHNGGTSQVVKMWVGALNGNLFREELQIASRNFFDLVTRIGQRWVIKEG